MADPMLHADRASWAQGDTGDAMSDHEQTLRKMHHDGAHGIGDYTSIGPEEAAACLSGADALVRAKRTCGTCKWGDRVVGPWGDILMCKNKNAPAYVSGHVSPDDGCIKGWATREAE